MARGKKKKEKVENGLKKKKWGPVQTSLSVIGGVAGIVGATILGVYVAGGFKERVVNPEAISFVYQSELFNIDYNQIETCDDFTLTIMAPNQGITKDKVTLSFDGKNPVIKSDGYISNTIISVPEIVKIGQPFKVSLATEYLKNEQGEYILENNKRIDWIKGGISSLIAKSEYDQLSTTSIQIAVDVPVYKTETIVVNSTGVETNQIVTGESFTLRTNFIPTKSQYIFSDYYEDKDGNVVKNEAIGLNNARKKLSYFEAKNNSGVTPVYEDKYSMHFLAGDEAVDSITVTGYTYHTAKEQIDFQKTLVDISDNEFYNANVVNLASSETKITSAAQVSISEASISTFTVSQNSINAEINKPFRLYVQENRHESASKFIGARVISTSGAILDNMTPKIALAFVYNNQDAVGNILDVAGVDSGLNILFGSNEVKLYQPNSNVSDLRHAYWTLTATELREIEVYTYLIVDGELFKDENNEVVRYQIALNVQEHAEGDLSWVDQTQLNVTLSIDDDKLTPQTINLGQFVSVPPENIYQDVIFFAYFGERTEDNKTTIDDLVKGVIGANGYDPQSSGKYAVGSNEPYLYAINGDSITLYNTGVFRLYFATVSGEHYEDGTYKIVLMAEGYKQIDCRKALSEDSINTEDSVVTISDESFVRSDDEMILLDSGNANNFEVKFVVKNESIPVFKEEFDNGNIQLKIMSGSVDVTSNFNVTDAIFDANNGFLTYTLYINETQTINAGVSAGVSNAIYITGFKVVQKEGDLSWSKDADDIILYKPTATSVVLTDATYIEYLNSLDIARPELHVKQTLSTEGTFAVSVYDKNNNVLFEDVDSFITTVFPDKEDKEIVVTDQLGQTDKLKGQWHFVVSGDENHLVNLLDDGKSFAFRNGSTATPITISINSNDNQATCTIQNGVPVALKLTVESQGIQNIKYSKVKTWSWNPSDVSQTGTTEDISRVEVEKYGKVVGKTSFTDEMLKFYVGEDAKFEKLNFNLDPTYISAAFLPDTNLLDLFGQNGMITLYNNDTEVTGASDASTLRTSLTNANITAIQINRDFASEHTIKFLITDSNNVGAVNTVFNLVIKPNLTINSVTYTNIYTESNVTLTNQVTNVSTGISSGLSSCYGSNTQYYIVKDEDINYYEISDNNSNAVGEFKNGNLKFYDFWDEDEQKDFNVRFQPGDANIYSIDFTIIFSVTRNVEVKAGTDTYYILGASQSSDITDFVSVTRKDGQTKITGVDIEYSFDEYLTIEGNTINLKPDVKFGYNQQELTTKLSVKIEDVLVDKVDITITIKPLYDESNLSFYQILANKFGYFVNDQLGSNAKIKNIDGVQYLMVDISEEKTGWKFTNDTYSITAQKLSQNSFYNVVSGKVIFTNPNALLYGIGNQSAYLDLTISQGATQSFKAQVPVIVSSIGFDQVVYDGHQSDTKSLEYALTRPEALIKSGIYNEITAGRVTDILNNGTTTGLFTLDGNVNIISFYPFEEIDEMVGQNHVTARTSQSLIRSLTIDNNNKTALLSLNHLADSVTDMYLAFEYTVISGTSSQTFYYVLKVIPDVTIKSVVYPYFEEGAEDGEEHISSPLNTEGEINLQNAFDNTTLHEGEKRFNVTGAENIAFKNEIYSVTIDDHMTLYVKDTTSEVTGWGQYIDLTFSDDYSTLYFTPKTNSKFKIVLKHTYPGSNDSLSIVGGVQYYNLVLNENSVHYSLRYTLDGAVLPNDDDYTWKFKNYNYTAVAYYTKVESEFDENETYYTFNSTSHTYEQADITEFADGVVYYTKVETSGKSILINLIENAQAGQSQSGTVVYEGLHINMLEGEIPGFNYDVSTGSFVLTLDEYLEQDKTLEFVAYTKYGKLGRLTVKIGANAAYTLKTDTNLTGGTDENFADIFDITLDGLANTAYTVAADIDGAGNFVTFDEENGKFTVADLLEDKQISVTFTVTFTEDTSKTFVFTQDFTLKQNITPKSSYTPENNNVISGGDVKAAILDAVSNFYYGTISKSTVLVTQVSSTNPVYNNGAGTTNYVSEVVDLDLTVTVTLTFNDNTTQTFELTYSLHVYPSVELSTTYPQPNSSTYDAEYIENGSTFNGVLTNFINTEPMFATSARVIAKAGAVNNNTVSYNGSETIDATDLEIKVQSLSNASVMRDNQAILTGNQIGYSDNISFHRGIYNNGSYIDNGTMSQVALTITYKNVVTTYTIVIMDNVITSAVNMATNNVNNGEYPKDSSQFVDYETIYVDKTSVSDMFAEGRMGKVETATNLTGYENTYYLVFEDDNYYYASYPIYFGLSDQGKSLTLDLGRSFAGKTFVGAYIASIFDAENSGVTQGANGKLTFTAGKSIDNFTNLASSLFVNGALTLANRIQLLYAGEDVDYRHYSSILPSFTVNTTDTTIDDTSYKTPFNGFFLANNGSGQTWNLTGLQYYYKPTIDIDVVEKINMAATYKEVQVNLEDPSVVDLFGIKHPTTGKNFAKSDFTASGASLTLELVHEVSSDLQTIADKYISEYEAFASDKQYLMFTALLTNDNTQVYDYKLLPMGAKNTGYYQLIKITYSISGFKKPFYTVVRILPDYILSFGGSEGNIQDEGDCTSNTNPYVLTVNSHNKYGDDQNKFTLTAGDGTAGYLSVKHANGNDTTAELATSAFTINLTKDQSVNGTIYNDKDNVKNKLKGKNSGISSDDSAEYTLTNTTFTDVPEVVFGNQYYMIEGVDYYGYKYRVYFVLQSSHAIPEPAASSYAIRENEYFDIGAEFQLLTIAEGSVTQGKTNLYITSETTQPVNTSNSKLITLQGIDAWLFDNDYVEGTNQYLTKNGGSGYTVNDTNYTMSSNDQKYLNISNLILNNVTVEGITLQDENGNNLGSITMPDSVAKTLATATKTTTVDKYYIYNGFDGRDVESVTSKMLKMPRITDTDIFKNSNVANITMIIKLKYNSGSNSEEYYYCPVNVSLQRDLEITENAVLAHDGEAITVSSNYNVGAAQTSIKYFNDTLEVVIATNSSTSFEMTLTRGGNTKATTTVSLSNSGTSYTKTHYLSLSSRFNTNVKEDDTVTIKNVSGGCVAMYYEANNSKLTFTNDEATFTISDIEQDYIYVDNALMLQANKYYTTTKYYILNYTEDETTYSYRLSKQYYVVGKYYKMAPQTAPVDYVLNSEDTTGFATWSNAINLYDGSASSTGIGNGNAGRTPNKNYLVFEIDSTGGGSGNATIDENGDIAVGAGWTSDQYITVVVKMKVSGYDDRNIANQYADEQYVILGSLKLGSGKYAITYKDKGDIEFSGQKAGLPAFIQTGQTITLPTPIKDGYTFAGWYSDSDCTAGHEVTQLTNVTSDQTVYAKWRPNVLTINYHLNGGEDMSETAHFSNSDPARVDNWEYDVEWPDGLTNPSSDRVQRTGYTASQVYYNTKADGTGLNVAMDNLTYSQQVAQAAGVLDQFEAGDVTIDLYVIWTAYS